MQENRIKIETALTSLKSLLANTSILEDGYQEWFEKNNIALTSLGIIKSIPHPKLVNHNENELVPDFLIQLINQTWEIFELKLPYTKILKNKEKRNTFYAKTYEYIQQCLDYSEFFSDSVNRHKFEQLHNFIIPVPPRCKLIIGRDEGLDRYELIKLLDNQAKSIDILTYDDIIRHLEFLKINTLGNYENIPGLTIHFIANIHNSNFENHIITLGDDISKNNISIYVNYHGDLCFRIIDENGTINTSIVDKDKSNFEFDKTSYFVFELGLTDGYSIISTEVNGKYGSVNQIHKLQINIDNLFKNIVIGSNANGTASGDFEMLEQIIWPKTLRLDDRIAIRNNVFENYFQKNKVNEFTISFFDNRFFHTNSHKNFEPNTSCKPSDLVQTVNKKQPGIIGKNMPKGEFYVPVFYNQGK